MPFRLRVPLMGRLQGQAGQPSRQTSRGGSLAPYSQVGSGLGALQGWWLADPGTLLQVHTRRRQGQARAGTEEGRGAELVRGGRGR